MVTIIYRNYIFLINDHRDNKPVENSKSTQWDFGTMGWAYAQPSSYGKDIDVGLVASKQLWLNDWTYHEANILEGAAQAQTARNVDLTATVNDFTQTLTFEPTYYSSYEEPFEGWDLASYQKVRGHLNERDPHTNSNDELLALVGVAGFLALFVGVLLTVRRRRVKDN